MYSLKHLKGRQISVKNGSAVSSLFIKKHENFSLCIYIFYLHFVLLKLELQLIMSYFISLDILQTAERHNCLLCLEEFNNKKGW